MYIVDINGIFPENLRDKWITFQTLVDVLKPSRILLPSKYDKDLTGNYLYFFFDGGNQAVLFNYMDPYGNFVWVINKSKFTFNNGELRFPYQGWRRRKRRKRIKIKLMDLESAGKFIEYLELF